MSVETLLCRGCGSPVELLASASFAFCDTCGDRVSGRRQNGAARAAAPPRAGGRKRPQPAAGRNDHALVKKRMEGVFLLFLAGIGVLGARLVDLQFVKSRGFTELADKMQGRTLQIDAIRGNIKDRNNGDIAMDVPGKAVAINPRLVSDPAATARRLAELLKLDDKQRILIEEKISKSAAKRSAYSQLRRGVDRRLAENVLKLSKTEPDLKGITLEDSPMRVWPAGRDGIQLVGRVSSDRRGIEGFEVLFEPVLRGRNGESQVRVSATGQPIPESVVPLTTPQNGHDVRLTIDRDIQHFVEAELEKVAGEQQPDAATAIVMDVHTGDVLAMANWPSFTPGQVGVNQSQLRNRAITDLFEPGSIFKVITAGAALEYGVKTDTYCSGVRAIGNRSIHCAHGAHHGACDLKKMIEQSCNLGAGSLAERVGAEHMYEFLDRMGLQSKTGIEFPGEEHGRLLPADKWRTMRTVNIGFGQGVVVTPIQLLSAYAAIANDGVYNPPRLVLDAPGANLPVRQPRRVMSAENAIRLRSCMEAVVTGEHGTGKAAKIAGYSVGGKTGTAQIAQGGHYGHGYVASFAGFVPAVKPKLAIMVSVWHPRRGQYGGVVSAPVFREIARQSVAFLKIPPDAPEDPRDGAERATFQRYAHNPVGGGHTND
jgi:cell division protein FtsI/penicillin-binding protein 2